MLHTSRWYACILIKYDEFFSVSECTDGKNCVNTNFYHYQDFRHTDLAEERALASPDHSEVTENNLDLLEDELELLEHSPNGKRKRDTSDRLLNKRARTPSIIFSQASLHEKDANVTHSPNDDDGSNPFFNPEALAEVTPEKGRASRPGSRASEDPNPFLNPEEFESSGDEDGPGVDGSEAEEAEEERADAVFSKLEGETSIPCIPGVCDAKQLAVTVTLSKPDGMPIKVSTVYMVVFTATFLPGVIQYLLKNILNGRYST